MTDDGVERAQLRCGDFDCEQLEELLARFGLQLVQVAPGLEIPGSYWGSPEAGLLGQRVYARADTPLHSLFHEAAHAICMSSERRACLHTDAGGDDLEESAVCYLQLVLAEQLEGAGSARLMSDMDAWGYSFRLGSTRAWFEQDAEDARDWLLEYGVLERDGSPSWRVRT